MLELVDLSKKFKQTYAVKNLNMFIEKGEIVGLLGPNGAGKSTAISMLSSLVEPTSGDVRFNNQSILKNPTPLRKVIGVVPQEIALYTDLTAEENLQFFGRIYKLKGIELHQKINEVLDMIGLTDRRKDMVKTFSGGMKRRLNIGVALLHDPEFIIMDEPTVGIDPQSRNYILETVKRLNKEKQMTVLYTSHYMEEVEFLCNRIYIMDQGNLSHGGSRHRPGGRPEGQLTWGIHVSLAPTWFDPAETPGIITPYMVLYALHDGMVKPMPGKPQAPSLAELWSTSRGRADATNSCCAQGREVPQRRAGDGGGRQVLVRALPRHRARPAEKPGRLGREPIGQRVRFKLKEPWADFLTFYTTASGAGWIVPKKYVEKVGDDGFKKAPDRRRPLQVRVVQRRASSWCSKPSTVIGARCRASSGWS